MRDNIQILLRSAALLCGVWLAAGQAPAQGDPMREILEIAERVDAQLKEVDRLLLESSAANQARSKPVQLLEQSQKSNAEATQSIEELIEKLTELKNQSGGGGQSQQQQQDRQQQDQQQQQQQQQGQQGQQNRRENQTPDFVKQEDPKPGQQQGEQQQGEQQQGQQQQGQQQQGQQQNQDGQPQGGRETNSPGENRQGNNPPQSETGPGQPGTGEGSWGDLQPYVNFLKNRGSQPKVPQKYRKYWEAYLKNKRETPSGSGSGGGR